LREEIGSKEPPSPHRDQPSAIAEGVNLVLAGHRSDDLECVDQGLTVFVISRVNPDVPVGFSESEGRWIANSASLRLRPLAGCAIVAMTAVTCTEGASSVAIPSVAALLD
jgi:hypothetical protein